MASRLVLIIEDFEKKQLARIRQVSPDLNFWRLPSLAHAAQNPEFSQTEILYANSMQLRALKQIPKSLKWVQLNTVGVDHLYATSLWKSKVTITSMKGVHTVSMAEYCLAMILAFRWNLIGMKVWGRQGKWKEDSYERFAQETLPGKVIGIVGYGTVGREIARLTQVFGMKVLAVNSTGTRKRMKEVFSAAEGDPEASIPEKIFPSKRLPSLAKEVDFCVVTVPLTKNTRGLISAQVLSKMKRSAFLIVISRGGVVHEKSLIEALKRKWIAGAAIDVFEKEPLPQISPFFHLDNVFLSPHVAGWSTHFYDGACALFIENLRRYTCAQPLLNVIDRGKGY